MVQPTRTTAKSLRRRSRLLEEEMNNQDEEQWNAGIFERPKSGFVKQFNVDKFHDSNQSVADIFTKIHDSEYRPVFTIINCPLYARTAGSKQLSRDRKHSEFKTFLTVIEALGGRTTMLPTSEISKAIPLLFETHVDEFNVEVATKWKENEANKKRVARDVFSERFITDILDRGTIGDLNEYRVGETPFRTYDANSFLSGALRWQDVKKLS